MRRKGFCEIFEKIDITCKVLRSIIFKIKFPLGVTWNITYRCNLKCGYCGIWQKKVEELDTQSVFNIINELANSGTKFIKFTGGEPILRKDFEDIVSFCKAKNMHVFINSNGSLIKKEFSKIEDIDEVQFSLDGPRHIHDAIRGIGVHDNVIEAIEICKDRNINVFLNTVLSKYNIAHISYILNVAKKYKIGVFFQPVAQSLANSDDDILALFGAEEKEYKEIINYLMEEKLRGNKYISNSISGLRYIYCWPHPQKINCAVSFIHLLLEPDGKIFICNIYPNYQKYLVSISASVRETFDRVRLPQACSECWCGSLTEFNLAVNLKLDSMLETWKRFSQQ